MYSLSAPWKSELVRSSCVATLLRLVPHSGCNRTCLMVSALMYSLSAPWKSELVRSSCVATLLRLVPHSGCPLPSAASRTHRLRRKSSSASASLCCIAMEKWRIVILGFGTARQ